MEAGEQPNPDRDTGVPHVIRPANEKSPGHEPPANVSGPKNSGRQRANGLAGNQQSHPSQYGKGDWAGGHTASPVGTFIAAQTTTAPRIFTRGWIILERTD